jgi:uncharacterized RDD family membrane protein YckC
MPCPRCVGECRCTPLRAQEQHSVLVDPESYDPSEEHFSQSLVSARPMKNGEAAPALPNSDSQHGPVWRREVAQRVNRYRTRRGYSAEQESLSFNFGSALSDSGASTPGQSSATKAAAELDQEKKPANDVPADTNIIEFPRLSESLTYGPLIEPVEELAPRIFEAEEIEGSEEAEGADRVDEGAGEETGEASQEHLNTSVAIAPLLPSFAFEPLPAFPHAEAPAEVEVPVQVACVGIRAFAAVLDVMVALVAAGLFTLVARQFGALPSDPKMLLAVEVILVGFFWSAYQFIYLTYAGRTLGMAVTGLAVFTFEGNFVTKLRRQARVISMLLSALSLGLGFAWAFFDEDTLCWHDRITRTVVR